MRNDRNDVFTESNLRALVDDLKRGPMKVNKRVTVCDPIVTGLRAVVSRSGGIALSACYTFDESRPLVKLGEMGAPEHDPEYMTIDDARELTKVIKALADRGINIEEEIGKVRQKLLRDVLEKGEKWRPKL